MTLRGTVPAYSSRPGSPRISSQDRLPDLLDGKPVASL